MLRTPLACLAPTLLLAAACASDPAAQRTAIDGGALYLRQCSVCHGEKGDGRSLATPALAKPPRDFTSMPAREGLSREYMIAIVRDGRPHSPMMARSSRLTQEQVEAVVDYVRERFMREPAR